MPGKLANRRQIDHLGERNFFPVPSVQLHEKGCCRGCWTNFWGAEGCFCVLFIAIDAHVFNKLQALCVMAWKRSTVRSRSGPPIIS